jgi:phospholipid/cholesterol/gamma-HCH transport system ATP-binding protein
MTALREPILDLDVIRAEGADGEVAAMAARLQVMPGASILIEGDDAAELARFADLCSGMVELAEGRVHFLGRDWARMPRDIACAARGRIGRTFADGGWIDAMDAATNVVLAQLHHTRRDLDELRRAAASLARAFGLPGLPLARPSELSAADRRRAACVRALLGRPLLLLLEQPLLPRDRALAAPLVSEVAAALSRGGAAIWLITAELPFAADFFSERWRLDERGLSVHWSRS